MSATSKSRLVFGNDIGDLERAAAQSSRLFVRDQDHVAFHKPGATGRVLTALEAYRAFGFDKLFEAVEYGAAVIVGSPEEPGATIRRQREIMGLTQPQLAKAAEVPVDVVEAVERGKARVSIHALERLTQVLALDDRMISWVPGAGADGQLAVRLRDFASGSGGLSASAVASLGEAAWVARTESRLASWLGPTDEVWRSFNPVDDFGARHRPAWRVGYDLAGETRRRLGLAADAPVQPLREIINDLGIVLIQAELPLSIAGATVTLGSQRAIVVNVSGANNNPWIRRATMAHELGHLLWDPEQRLNHLRVDTYGELERSYSRVSDPVEARANAFAIALLAPPEAVMRVYRSQSAPAAGLRAVMETFGISVSAARNHIMNSFGNAGEAFHDDVENLRCNSAATQEWVVNENLTLDWFPIQSTPLSRRGTFATRVVEAEQKRLISSSTAATYLATDIETFEANRDVLAEVLGLKDGQ